MVESGKARGSVTAAGVRPGDPRGGEAALKGRIPALGAILCGALVVALAAALAFWARASAWAVPLRAIRSLPAGLATMALGLALCLAGARELTARRGGLPLSADSRRPRVGTGVYRVLAHPIHLGVAVAALGLAVVTGSGSGLWLVLPTLALALVALVLGLEGPALERRRGPARASPLLSLPPASGDPARPRDRLAVYLFVGLPWLATYCAARLLGPAPDAFSLELAGEVRWPVLEWSGLAYASCYVLVPLVPLVLRTRAELRRFAVNSLLATAVVGLIWLLVPVVAPHRPFEPQGWLGQVLLAERAASTGVAAFPSFHVLWALLAADALARRSRAWAWTGRLWALAIATSAVTTGLHALADVVAALAVFPLLRDPGAAWAGLRAGTEALARRAWRPGRVQVVSHQVCAGLAGALGYWIVASAAAGQPRWAILAVAMASLLGAGILPRMLRSSGLRPFVYYGGVPGAVAGAALAGGFGAGALPLVAAAAAAAPWVQAIGRLGCLVRGCYHGAREGEGIVDSRPGSVVPCRAGFARLPMRPTPFSSIACDVVLGLILLRLWSLGAAATLLIGVYLIGTGLGGFVAEGYRGEPPPAMVVGLRIHQWLAIASAVAGAIVTCVATGPVPEAGLDGSAFTIVTAVLFGTLAGAAMGEHAGGWEKPRQTARLNG